MRTEGFDIHHIHRTNRMGFKAGALENGLRTATGKFIAIFDADFIPAPNFLEDVIQHFTDPKVGMIQVRWGHINREYSLLTQVESVILDGHFVIEHGGRHLSGRFFNFNGTAGIWRREAIETAGGWQHDTLTEDTDLSYRAQMIGWNFLYLPAHRLSGRTAGRNELVQDTAVPLGQGPRTDRNETAAANSAQQPSVEDQD